jgi:hypothetical protein
MFKKGTYVMVRKIVLKHDERSSNLPDDTKVKDFMMKIKGYLLHDADMYDEVSIETETKRVVKGKLVEVNPSYTHSFGDHVDEIDVMKKMILEETR